KLCAAGLRAEGFGKGDAIGIHLPMIPETVILLLAINRIGAIAIPVFSGYGVEAIASRMEAVGAKALFTVRSFPRRGKQVKASEVAFEAAEKCHTVRKAFVIPAKFREYSPEEKRELAKKRHEEYEKLSAEEKEEAERAAQLGKQAEREKLFTRLLKMGASKEQIEKIRQEEAKIEEELQKNRKAGIKTVVSRSASPVIIPSEKFKSEFPFDVDYWKTLLETGKENLEKLSHLEPTNAEEPLIILYTSGTTGKPKGIAHTHCSFPIKAAQDMAFGTDVGRGTRISWVTDIGWMMGPWLIYGALINGATICIYDGAPDYPEADRMWEFCAKHRVEILGISPTLVRALATKGDDLPKKHDLSNLRAFASTGEPWNPAPWWWLFEKVGSSKLPIINYSGGTEISGGILMNNPLVPIKPCSFSAPCPGIDADILDDTGKPVGANQVGELAIKTHWIGMARGFWQERERYLETYWNRFEDIWVHGDWAMKDKDGHWFILGRSDDTLKVAGKRVGPAEVESLLVAHQLVIEAAVIGVPDEMKGTAMVAFCVLGGNAGILPALSANHENNADDSISGGDADKMSALQSELKSLVAKDMGKPLTPSRIHFVSALPKTRNAKVMRRVIRAAYLGEDAGDLSALENPNAVEEIQRHREN
ncbi:MAG: AMP-binding protein, partial [Pyrinomonadaceae bacterium]